MEDAIVDKLKAILVGGIDSECKVVYVLAESRKLFPKYKTNPNPFALKLYSHWALHVNLSYPNTTREFLELVDAFVASFLEGNTDIGAEHRMLRDFVFLDTFKQQFRTFLNAFDLPTAICDDDAQWHEFLRHYSGVIEDGSLACEGDDLKLVEKVIFTKGRPRASGMYIPFDLSWDIVLLNKKTLTVEVNAAPFTKWRTHDSVQGASTLGRDLHAVCERAPNSSFKQNREFRSRRLGCCLLPDHAPRCESIWLCQQSSHRARSRHDSIAFPIFEASIQTAGTPGRPQHSGH
jgi:hypothetical protein